MSVLNVLLMSKTVDPQDTVTKKYVDDTVGNLNVDLTSLTNLIDDRIAQIVGTLDKLTPKSIITINKDTKC